MIRKNISSGFFHVTVGSFGSDDITFLRHDMNAEVGGNKNDGHFDLNVANEYDMFFYRYIGTHRLIIAGVSDHAVALSEIGLKMGYRVVVVDPRPMFLNESRFNKEIELELKWPEDYISEIRDTVSEKDSLCMLSHDEKFDIPALKLAVDLPFGYIGAIGSRVTAEKRFQKLKDLGIGQEKLSRIFSPIGLDLGATNSNEIALAIIAQIVAVKNSRSGNPLKATFGNITAR